MTRVARLLRGPRSSYAVGVLVLIVIATAFVVVYQKEALKVAVNPGDTVQVEFSRDYKLVPANSDVKMAGVDVGKVSDVEEGESGHGIVSLKLDDGVVDKLGSKPTASIRPTTVLGGKYYVELQSSGDGQPFSGDKIPVQRTSIPVELDEVLAAVPPPAQQGLRTTAKQLDRTLAGGGREAVQNVLRDAPATLRPAGSVLSAAQGSSPGGADLSRLVTNTDSLASALTRQDGQLGKIVDSLSTVSAGLSDARQPMAQTVRDLPQTLDSTRSGVRSLRGTLDRLTATASDARPAARQLRPLLDKVGPVARSARPLVHQLRPLLRQLRPTADDLVPTAQHGTRTLDNISGPVLDRVKGPITNTVLSPWHGKGFYKGDGSDHPFYKEVGYLGAGAANLSKYSDKNGAMVALAAGAGLSTPGGTDLTTERLFSAMGVLPPNGAGSLADPPSREPGPGQLLPGQAGPLGQLKLPEGLPQILGDGNGSGR